MGAAAEQQLVEAARGGDRAALEQLLRRYQSDIFRFGMRMCGDPEDAQDVLQETLLAMARTVRDFRGASSMSTWLYVIARSFCIKKRRRSKSAPPPEAQSSVEPQELSDPQRDPEDQLAAREMQLALEQAINDLAPDYREVLVLRDVEGLTANEVAEVVGITAQAVKSRLHRARARVRERVARVPAPIAQSGRPTCPDVVELFSRHLEGDVGADQCAAMERHLEECKRCQGLCDSLREVLGCCRRLRDTAEPAPSCKRAVERAIKNFLDEQRLPSVRPLER